MNFKKPKQEVLNKATTDAYSAINNQLSYIKYNYSDNSPKSIISSIEMAINEGIRAALTSIVEDIYTDEEFEKDLTLRS